MRRIWVSVLRQLAEDPLATSGHMANRKRARLLMAMMGIEAIYRRPTVDVNSGHPVYPYILQNLATERPNQVRTAYITYIPAQNGYVYRAR